MRNFLFQRKREQRKASLADASAKAEEAVEAFVKPMALPAGEGGAPWSGVDSGVCSSFSPSWFIGRDRS